ncbi:MAG: DNA recombination protein RmuC [Candidatus Marinimicrobia bacterium]|nr:DNA recombination protein RmuC [Candidatus Neomarinimicrobiota bacterium]
MDQITLIVLFVLIGIFVGGFSAFFILNRKKSIQEKGSDFVMMQQQLNHLTDILDNKLSGFQKQFGESNKDIQSAVREQFGESQKLIQSINKQMTEQLLGVTKGVTEVTESTKQIFNVADQLSNLEKVLKHQKQRGNLGEASLELSLSNILPPEAYQMQYLFPDGDQVDAVVKTKEGLIPIDAKFSLDNYNRIVNEDNEERKLILEKEFKNDLKKRIDETAKYIRPKDGTLPFAFMFIPAEGIYYDLLVNEVGSVKVNTRSLVDYAYTDKNVIVVSPTTFSAYLHSVLYGFNALKIEESAKDIRKNVELLGRHLAAYDEFFNKLGKSISTSVSHYNRAQKELGKVDKDVLRITGEGIGVDTLLIDKPDSED